MLMPLSILSMSLFQNSFLERGPRLQNNHTRFQVQLGYHILEKRCFYCYFILPHVFFCFLHFLCMAGAGLHPKDQKVASRWVGGIPHHHQRQKADLTQDQGLIYTNPRTMKALLSNNSLMQFVLH